MEKVSGFIPAGPFSNKVAASEGELSLTIRDRTPVDGKNFRDTAELEAPFGEHTYRVVLENKPIIR